MKKNKRYYFRNIISWMLTLSMLLGTLHMPELALVVQAEEPEESEYSEELGNSEDLEITLHRASVTKLPAAGVDLKYQGFEKKQWLLVYPGEADTKMEYQVQ